MKFIWDARKAQQNLWKHGISFDEASTVFGDPFEVTIPDREHSLLEHRFISMVVSSAGRLLSVCYSEVGNTIRIISARRATAHERQDYEG